MAFGAWVENIVAKLDSSATVEYTLQPNFAGDIIFATVTVPSIGAATMDLTYYHYDSLTRVKANPVNAVEASLKWYSAHPVE